MKEVSSDSFILDPGTGPTDIQDLPANDDNDDDDGSAGSAGSDGSYDDDNDDDANFPIKSAEASGLKACRASLFSSFTLLNPS